LRTGRTPGTQRRWQRCAAPQPSWRAATQTPMPAPCLTARCGECCKLFSLTTPTCAVGVEQAHGSACCPMARCGKCSCHISRCTASDQLAAPDAAAACEHSCGDGSCFKRRGVAMSCQAILARSVLPEHVVRDYSQVHAGLAAQPAVAAHRRADGTGVPHRLPIPARRRRALSGFSTPFYSSVMQSGIPHWPPLVHLPSPRPKHHLKTLFISDAEGVPPPARQHQTWRSQSARTCCMHLSWRPQDRQCQQAGTA